MRILNGITGVLISLIMMFAFVIVAAFVGYYFGMAVALVAAKILAPVPFAVIPNVFAWLFAIGYLGFQTYAIVSDDD